MRSAIVLTAGIVSGLALGWFVFPLALYSTEPQPLHFSHATHAGEKAGMACADCHAVDEQGRFQGIPAVAKCAECHSAPIGESASELQLVEQYVTPNREIEWKVYARQPDNAHFPHNAHVTLGAMECADCHGPHGSSDTLRAYQVNRISGYSRDIWGPNISGFASNPWEGMKMDRCVRCHDDRGRRDGCVACHK
ncbi:MAG: cytochrome c3 family protein [Bacteroidetes bacterium]|nr:MAG: cytochrome c3 family protein [Bacteroidota bacterium]